MRTIFEYLRGPTVSAAVRVTTLTLFLVPALASGCGDDAPPPMPDAGDVDAAIVDARVPDADAEPENDATTNGFDTGVGTDAAAVPDGLCPDGPLNEPPARWANTWVGAENQQVFTMAVDSGGAAIFTGRSQGSIDFGDGPVDPAGNHDVFVTKVDSAGALVWSRHFIDTDDDSEPRAIAVDGSDNVLVTGYVKGTVDFGAGPVAPARSTSREIFVAKLSADGDLLWVNRYGLSSGWGIGTGPADQVVVVGQLSGTLDFGGGEVTATGQGDAFLLRLGANGSYLSHQVFTSTAGSGSGLDVAYAVDIDDSGNVVVGGYRSGPMDLGAGVEGAELGVFLVMLDAADDHVWGHVYDGGNLDFFVTSFTADGGVIVEGEGQGILDLGGGPLRDFVAKLDAGGAHVWSREVDLAPLPSSQVAFDASGGLWAAAAPRAADLATCTLASGQRVFATRFREADGALLEARSVMGPVAFEAWGIGTDGNDVISAGWLSGTGGDLGTGPFGATSANDPFVARYGR